MTAIGFAKSRNKGPFCQAGGGAPTVRSEQAFAPPGTLPLPSAARLVAQGQRADGAAVTVQGVWFARAMGPQVRLYHAVVYTAKPRPDVADAFFAGLTLH